MKTYKNKKALKDFFILDELEVGIVLRGSEIKSIRAGNISFKDSYAKLERGEIWLYNLHISGFKQASYNDHEPERKRKLLLHKKQINKFRKKIEEKGLTLIPKNLYINEKGLVKVTLAIAKGKRNYDKRDDLQKKDQLRDMERKVKNYG
ncbi:MAG: SsrA-binding protein SmpB [Candidatus Cloacimonetes bacterium]|nr:SsrA-binding protein SmpB [Candidatus Cloacimonadota bacterium]